MLAIGARNLSRSLGGPAIMSLALVLPFMSLELINRGGLHSGFPVALFSVMWLLPLAFFLILRPIVASFWANEPIAVRPLRLLFRAVLSMLIAWFWIGLVVDQMPCFLGIPNCD